MNTIFAEKFVILSMDLFCVVSFDGYFLELNQGWEKALGWTLEELKSKPFMEFIHPDDRGKTENVVTTIIGGTPVSEFQNRYKHKNGTWRILSWRGTTSHEEKLMYGAARDITEQQEEEKRHNAERERLLSILNATPDIIAMATPDGQAMYQNEAATKLWGPKLKGQRFEQIHPNWARKIVIEEGIPEAIKNGYWNGETTILDKQKSEIPVWQTILAHKNHKGEVEFFSTVIRDLSQLKAERLRAIQSSKLAALGEMSGGIAHEINNPLAIIHGKSTQLKQKALSGNIKSEFLIESLEKIETTVMRIAKIVRGLRTFSRSSVSDPFNVSELNTIVDDTLSLCMSKFQSDGIEIKVKPFESIRLSCRPVQISQVLLNLLNNSRDAISNLSSKWIEISAEKENGNVLIKITDSGNGIPRAIAERMMEPFFTTKEVGKGTGLGLSISKGIIDGHKGILYYNEKSNNTQFVIELPRSA